MLLVLSAAAHAKDAVTIREVSKDGFVATLMSNRQLSIEEAQQVIFLTAEKYCEDLSPEFGHYEFNSSKRISTADQSPDSFEFNQSFTCKKRTAEIYGQALPTVIDEEKRRRLIDHVTIETRNFIGSSSGETIQSFHARFSPELSSMFPLADWVKEQAQLHKNAGTIEKNPSFKVTTYVDPPNSPGPGFYIAVDFQASYGNAPFRCGYVMWLFDQQSNLTVLRFEDGIIYSKEAASMTAEAVQQTKQQFRCFAP